MMCLVGRALGETYSILCEDNVIREYKYEESAV